MIAQVIKPYAVPPEGRLGRIVADPPDEDRLPFQRDRDRIIHSTAFRRLQGKTQVFEAGGENDHVRTRLTHSMEVALVARDLSRRLGLNEDLAECIALAHDLGHPPFGHSGEDALDAWMKKHGGHFEHNEHSLRIVNVLERHSSLYDGLNLNREVLEGLQKHTALETAKGTPLGHALEAQIVDHSDAIAYTAHDCDDALSEQIFSLKDILTIPLAKRAHERAAARGTRLRGSIISLLTEDVLRETEKRITLLGIRTLQDVYRAREHVVGFSPDMERDLRELQNFLHSHLYLHPKVLKTRDEGQHIIELLCSASFANPQEKLLEHQQKFSLSLAEAVCDYVAGMTDGFARNAAANLG